MKPLSSHVLICTIIIVSSVIFVQSANDIKQTTTELSSSVDTGVTGAEKALLILEVIVNSEIASALVMASGPLAVVLGPALEIVRTILPFFIRDRVQEGLDKIENAVDNINWKLEALSFQIADVYYSLRSTVENSLGQVAIGEKMTRFFDAIRPIDSAKSDFAHITLSYSSDNVSLAYKLNEFAGKLRQRRCHESLVLPLNRNTSLGTPIVDDLIILGAFDKKEKRWSVTTMIYILHITVQTYLLREFALLRAAYESIEKIIDTNEIENLNLVNATQSYWMKEFFTSLATVPGKLNATYTNCREHVDLKILSKDKIVSTYRPSPGVVFSRKPINAPPGYVVTGVRWVTRHNANYLQIQVGKLRGMGQVIENTVTWQKLPDDCPEICERDHHILEVNHRSVILNNPGESARDLVVTGYVFELHPRGIELCIQKKRISDFEHGVLAKEIYNPVRSKDISVRDVLQFIKKRRGLAKAGPMIVSTETVAYGFEIGRSTSMEFLPEFDGSDATFDHKVPLLDIVFIHYTNDVGYAGYIRPVVISIDYVYFYFSK